MNILSIICVTFCVWGQNNLNLLFRKSVSQKQMSIFIIAETIVTTREILPASPGP